MSSAAILLGEAFSLQQLIGALLMMAGLAVHVFGGRWEKYLRNNEKIRG
jgi:O-acetylserine/cysteine efflux transporter